MEHRVVALARKHLHFDFLIEKEQGTRSGSLIPLDYQELAVGS